ncbi:MAG: murJ 2 [Deltaproteobacteria bacterium]|nr:murJ 2 [Deltaproteobacteria bacterium]
MLAQPIVALIFEHGKFTAFDTMQTAHALTAYGIGLAGYGAIKVLSPAFYALNDARTPMLISLGSIAVNYLMNSLLVGPFGHVGLACSTSAVALVNFLLLALFMRQRSQPLPCCRLADFCSTWFKSAPRSVARHWFFTLPVGSFTSKN